MFANYVNDYQNFGETEENDDEEKNDPKYEERKFLSE